MKKEYYFYAIVGAALLINELGIQYGMVLVTFPLALLLGLLAGLKFLSKG
jgi:hypothetical protein